MKYTEEIFNILSKGGFISSNSVSPAVKRYYDAIEEELADTTSTTKESVSTWKVAMVITCLRGGKRRWIWNVSWKGNEVDRLPPFPENV